LKGLQWGGQTVAFLLVELRSEAVFWFVKGPRANAEAVLQLVVHSPSTTITHRHTHHSNCQLIESTMHVGATACIVLF